MLSLKITGNFLWMMDFVWLIVLELRLCYANGPLRVQIGNRISEDNREKDSVVVTKLYKP